VPRLGIPIIMGWLRPAIYLPVSLCSGLTTAEVESVLLHEMAHLKRRDPFWQFVITTIETLLFYHPAAHALARQARESSEEACDNMVLDWTQDRHAYARALAALEETRGTQLLLAASGSPLRRRLRRIMGQPMTPETPLRFGFAGVAGVAAFLLFSFIGVPTLAQALTHEERVAVVAKMRLEWGGDRDPLEADKDELIAVGQAHFPPGTTPPASFPLMTSSSHSSYIMKAEGITGIKTKGRGESMQVLAWPKGFALARTQSSKRDPRTQQATFDLHFEEGFPAVFQLVDDKGQPVAGAEVRASVAFVDGGEGIHADPLITDAEGRVSPGHANADHRFEGYIMAHGFAWQTFRGLACAPDHPTVIQLSPAVPIRGEVVDEASGKPVAGCRVHCEYIHHRGGIHSFGGAPKSMPLMARSPSDAAGQVLVDLCGGDNDCALVFDANGYQPMGLVLNAGTRTFRMALWPAIVLEGVIRDPDRLLEYRDGKVDLWFFYKQSLASNAYETEKLSGDPSAIPFRFDHFAAGKVEFALGEKKKWSAVVEKSMTGMELVVKKDRLALTGEPEPKPSESSKPPRRTLEMVFDLPLHAPPLEGKIELSARREKVRPWVTIAKNRAAWLAQVSDEVTIQPRALEGWAFIKKTVKIEPGDGPQVVHLSCLPAGAIRGYVDTTLKPKFNQAFYVALLTCRHPDFADGTPWVSPLRWAIVETAQRSNHFFASPLPLGGTYKILAVSSESVAETSEITLDEAHPVREPEMKFMGDATLDGALASANATPLDKSPFYVLYREGGLTLPGQVETEAGGRFHLTDMDFHLPGSYAIYVPGGSGHGPLEVPITADSRDIKIQLQPGLPLDVVLLDEKDQPVRGIPLVVYPGESVEHFGERWHQEMHADGPSDAQGRIHFSCFAPGSHFIRMNTTTGWHIVADKPDALDSPVVKLPYSGAGPLRLRMKRDGSDGQ
jgi:hypothetical protein